MRNLRKMITGILAAAMVVGLFAAVPSETAAAAETEEGTYYDEVGDCYYYSVNDDGESVTITEYDGDGGDIEIPSEIDGMSVTSIGNCAFDCCYGLMSVTLPDSLTSIGNSAFRYCDLTSISIPNGVTYIGSAAFYCCPLTSIVIPDGVTTIYSSVFDSCPLTSIAIPKSVTSIGWKAFLDCFSLKDIYYAGSESDWDSITILGDNYGDEFEDDLSLITYDATIHYNSTGPDIGTGSEFTSGGATYQVTSATKNTVKFVSYSGTASKATIPATVTYGGTKYKVTAIAANAFSGNKNITSVTIGKNVKKIGNKAFKGCKNLKTVKINSTKLTSVGKNAFKGINASAKIKAPSDYKKAYKKLLTGSGYTGKVKAL